MDVGDVLHVAVSLSSEWTSLSTRLGAVRLDCSTAVFGGAFPPHPQTVTANYTTVTTSV